MQKKLALLIVPYIGYYPKPVDSEFPTPDEIQAISDYNDRKADFDGLYAKIVRNAWRLTGDYVDIINPRKGGMVRKPRMAEIPSRLGLMYVIPLNRIDPATINIPVDQWYDNKIAALKSQGHQIKGWSTNDWRQELSNRGYSIVESGE